VPSGRPGSTIPMSDRPSLFQRGGQYHLYRPDYPENLFRWLGDQCFEHQWALDLGCGTGQACRSLEGHFQHVIGADLSLAQLRGAPASASHYLAARADALPFADGSFDLITVAQALHWFPLPMFFKEAERVLREDALLAIISYGLCQVEGLPDLIDDFHDRVLAPWWPAARWSVVSGYRNVTLPWPEHKAPESLGIERHWHWRDLAAYLDTWSALAKARSFGKDPLRDFLPQLEQAWGEKTRKVRWPLRVRACRRPREY
jgi:SAM-dependent methyltransferase